MSPRTTWGRIWGLAALAAATLVSAAAQAQTPYGAPDISARLVAQGLQEAHGWTIVIENRTGANGNVAMAEVAKASPDGYTLIMLADSSVTINPHVYSKLGLDTLKDLIPIASVASNQFTLSVNPQVPAKTFKEFIDYARVTKPPLPYGSSGNGSQHHLAMEMLKQRAGIDLLHIPFRGAAPATQSTVAGDTKVLFSGSASASLIAGGQLRVLAASGKQRSKRYLPTLGEFYPGLSVDIWLGVFAPPQTPEPIVTMLRTEIHKLLARPDFAERLNVSGSLEPLILSPADFGALIHEDHQKYGRIVRDLHIQAE
jgi:tripartite-type tricarboxylate transporter receptor subunit TctC